MRRATGVVLALVLAACTAGEPPNPSPEMIASAPPSTAEPSVTPSPEVTLDPTATCDGLGHPPARGQITYIDEGRLMAASTSRAKVRCLAQLDDLVVGLPILLWNAPADRVLVGRRALSGNLTATGTLASSDPLWSRPTGTSVIWIDDGRLMKRPSVGGRRIDISFLARHDAVTYHPAGTHIATSGKAEDGSYGLYLATNVGTEPQLIARGDAARFISHLQFSEDGRFLHYDAKHGPRNWHLHRLSMGDDPQLETIDRGTGPYQYVVSPFPPHEMAWFESGDCVAGAPGTFTREFGRRFLIPASMRAQNIYPVGWVTPRKLVVRVASPGCSATQPGDVYVLSDNDEPVLIDTENHGSVAVRTVMPPPPPPPGEEQPVVA